MTDKERERLLRDLDLEADQRRTNWMLFWAIVSLIMGTYILGEIFAP